MKCETCLFENVEGTRYCQCCGKKLEVRRPLFAWGGIRPWAGVGQKGTFMAPLRVVAVEKQAEGLGEVIAHRTLVKVSPTEDSRWYCPDCGELNGKPVLTCKGCGRDLT